MTEAKRVLIVEDLPTDAELAQREIAKVWGVCEFRRVETRADFLEALESFRPALIVSDFQMPQFDGLTALKLALERCPEVPFIIVTGSMNEDTAVECMKAGAWDYVIKEHVKRLGPAVQAALERQRARIEATRSADALQASEALYRSLFANMLNGLAHCQVLFDQGRAVDFVYLDVNRAFEVQTGLKAVVGKKASEVTPGVYEANPELLEIYGRVAATGRPEVFEMFVRALDNWFIVSAFSPKQDHFVAVFDVITARKRAERDIQESKQLLEAVVEHVPLMIFLKEAQDLRFVLFNRAGEALLGHDRKELLGKNDLDFFPPGQAAFLMAKDREVLAADVLLDIPEEPIMTAGKGERLLHTRKVCIKGADGVAEYLLGISEDITDRKRAEVERAKLEEQLRISQKMETIGSLAGGVAHDFNNLLSVILSYTGFAIDALREGDPLKDDLQEVKSAADRAAALTRQLLAFSRKQVLQPQPLNLNLVTAELEKMLRRILGEDIEIRLVLAPDLGVVSADPGQIEQVLMNLVVNARDAMAKGGTLTIETSNIEVDEQYAGRPVPVTPGSYVRLAISDTGSGMDDETRARIFEPFFTTKEKGKGTGLGLSTVYGIVKQSGGNIWVDSERGKGTTFTIDLPRELAFPAAPANRPSRVPMRSSGTETVLVVEEQESLLRVTRRSLEAAGYRVLTASGGEAALRASAQHVGDIHLLLTDVVMPRMGGRAVAQLLSEKRPTLKVVYMSGYTDDAIVHHGVLDASTHFLAKPFTRAALTQKVREVLDRSPRDQGPEISGSRR